MKKSELQKMRKYVGDLGAVYGITPCTLTDGMANGVRALQLRNGRGLELTVLPDRGMDISLMRFHGMNVGFYSKTGISHPAFYQEEGSRGFLKRFYAGLLTTCGMTYAGAACDDEGRKLGLHGPFSNTPGEQVCFEEVLEGDEVVLRVRGQVREACVFEENMRLTREIKLETERNILHIVDTVENLGFAPSPCMMVYHYNFGYPLLDDGARVYTSAGHVVPRDEIAAEGFDKYDLMEEPGIERPEQCYFHSEQKDPEHAFAMIHNERVGIAAILHYDATNLPLLCEWKCMRAGDYALGLEPTTAGVMGRAYTRQRELPMLAPGESRTFKFALELADEDSVIQTYIKK